MTLTPPRTSHISIIIPTLNEEKNLEDLLESLQKHQELEIIVADGGSTDMTLDIASRYNVRVIHSPSGRGYQQNEGGRQAAGEILLFLHSDTRLPDNFPSMILAVLETKGVAAGAFRLKINAAGFALRLVEWGANLRASLLSLPYGDQALFVKKETFTEAGGFPDQPLLEDLELVRRLRRIGRIEIIPASVMTSARRWQKLGIIRTTLTNQFILLGYLCGMSPDKLSHLYYQRPACRKR